MYLFISEVNSAAPVIVNSHINMYFVTSVTLSLSLYVTITEAISVNVFSYIKMVAEKGPAP